MATSLYIKYGVLVLIQMTSDRGEHGVDYKYSLENIKHFLTCMAKQNNYFKWSKLVHTYVLFLGFSNRLQLSAYT